MSATSSFELHSGALRLALRPDLGGSIAGLWHRELPVLHSTEPDALGDVRDAACFPLVPYSGMLGLRRFRWKGREYRVEGGADGSPHALHGVGWRRGWDIVSSSAVDVVLRLRHDADDDWPFAFEASQYFTLTPQAMTVQIVFTNRAEIAQPVGLGWQPSFPKRERSRLHIDLSDRWDTDVTQSPIRKVAQPGIDSDVAHLDFDNCFEGWRGPARIRDERFSLQLTSSLRYLLVSTPQDGDRFCIDPVSHVSNAIHMAEPTLFGLRSVAPGESIDASMALEIGVV